ncbi:MAG: thrombospondin type 3 repeat-containing protein [Persicimonas sp.]
MTLTAPDPTVDRVQASGPINSLRWPLAVALALCLAGCTLDFDQFDERNISGADADDVGADAADGGGSIPSGGADLGGRCSESSDCRDGLECRQNYCTQSCRVDENCPSGSSCRAVGGEKMCLLDCDPRGECPTPHGRDDLRCVMQLTNAPMGTPSSADRACLPDRDEDNVADLVDNCPGEANALQRDADGDGDGDVCDDEAYCHEQADEGVIDYGSVAYEAEEFATPESTAHDWVPVVGGVDDEGEPIDTAAALDRIEGTWREIDELPYAADDLKPAAVTGQRYVMTPGVFDEELGEFGPHVYLEEDGVGMGPDYDSELYDETLVSTGLNQVVLHGYADDADSDSRSWQVRRFNPENSTYERISGGDASSRVDWHATVDMQGAAIFYSEVQSTDPATIQVLRVSEDGRQVTNHQFELPEPQTPAEGPFEPFIVPGPGQMLYAFDRRVGTAARLNLQSGTDSRISSFDLDLEFVDDRPVRFVAVPGSPSFIVVERDEDDDQMLRAREYFLPCLPQLLERDEDGDGVGDLIDNCPVEENAEQDDADFDAIGDACDEDADGDGIANDDETDDESGESYALDTDNDGVPNAEDDDIDGDGIEKTADRLPLDTDNNGWPNRFDNDADGDGYPNQKEGNASTDPLDPLNFPDAGGIVWTQKSDQERAVRLSALSAVDDAESLNADVDRLSRARVVEDGEYLFGLFGEAEATTEVATAPIDPQADTAVERVDLEVTLREAALPSDSLNDDGEISELVAIHRDDDDGWDLSYFDLGDEEVVPLVTAFDEIISVTEHDGTVYFVGAPDECQACHKVYTVPIDGGAPDRLDYALVEPEWIDHRQGRLVLGALASDGSSTAAYVEQNNSMVERRPPGATGIDSAAPVDDTNHLVVSARFGDGENHGLFLYNNRNERWYPLGEGEDDLVELDWMPSVPEFESTQE